MLHPVIDTETKGDKVELLTKEILSKIPGKSEDSLEARVWVKFFFPMTRWTWYASEYDPADGIFFGYVKGSSEQDDELGYWSLADLKSVPRIERDIYWKDTTTLRQVKEGEIT